MDQVNQLFLILLLGLLDVIMDPQNILVKSYMIYHFMIIK